MKFLPDDYVIPQPESKYYDFQEGENQFRILAPCTHGFVWWQEDEHSKETEGKSQAFYVRTEAEVPKSVLQNPNIEHRAFWAVVVFDRKTQSIKLLKITQTTIMREILKHSKSTQWGDVSTYDFVVTRKGTGRSSSYSVMALPKEPLDEGIWAMYREMYINPEALFDGRDPFAEPAEKQQAHPQAPNVGGQVHPPFETNGAATMPR